MLEIIENFGGRRDVLALFIFIAVFCLIASVITKKRLRLLFSILASLFVALQLISLFSTQSFLGYQFYTHFNLRGVTGMSGLFVPQIISLSVIFILLTLLYYHSSSLLKRLTKFFKRDVSLFQKRLMVMLFTITSFITIANIGEFIEDSKSLFTVFYSSTENFDEVLVENNMVDYITPELIRGEAGKNIVVISLESMERAFLSDEFSHLTPNLNKLKNSWNYYDIEQNFGSGWTSGSLYTYLTGFPAFFGKKSNSIFESTYKSKISSISHVLEKANYQTTYMNGNTDHSGVRDMLSALSFKKIIDKRNVDSNNEESEYGLRDKDLFEFAKQEIDLQQKTNNPFALFISTTDTHYPDGFYDSRMESVISKKDSDLQFMIAAVDYMIGDFIAHLDSNDMLKNTSVYIFPDHLKMGDPSIFKNSGKRGLYLITNAESIGVDDSAAEKLYQIDLPKIILKGADVTHNQKFLVDYITKDKNEFLRENINELTAINVAGLARLNVVDYEVPVISKHYESYKKDTLRYIAHGGGTIDGIKYTNSLEALNLSYDKGFRLFELDINETTDGEYVAIHDWERWHDMIGGEKGEDPVTYQEFMSHKLYGKYTPLSLLEINNWFSEHTDATLVTDKINSPKEFSKVFVDPHRLMMEVFTEDALKQGMASEILSPVVNQDLLIDMGPKRIIKLGVKHVAVSRFFIASNKDVLKSLKDNDIKVYVYSVNEDEGIMDSGKDEDYVTKYELDYVYGMYAGKWSFQ